MAEWVDLLDIANQKYDNTTSGLAATDGQAAIDEVAAAGGGDVTGPAGGTVDDEFALYDDTTGKLIRGAGGVTLTIITNSLSGKVDGAVSSTDREIVAFDGGSGQLIDGTGYTESQVITTTQNGQYGSVLEKATPVGADHLLLEDSADFYNKKYVQVSSLASTPDLTDAVFPTYAGFDAVNDTAAVNAGTTNINFSSGNMHRLTGTASTTLGNWTFPTPGNYHIIILSTVTIIGQTTANAKEMGSQAYTFAAGKDHILNISWDGTTARWSGIPEV